MGRLFRRVVRASRRPRRASGATTVRSAEGRQYRVVAVNEPEDIEFADPPRNWGRVGVMAGAWAVALAMGGWIAPGFAASGNPENVDSRDQAATDALGAALRYLRVGSEEDPSRAAEALCADASPEVTVSDLQDKRQEHHDALGGITRIDSDGGTPVETSEGFRIPVTIFYVYEQQGYEDFVATVQEHDGTYCVSNAVLVESEEPSASDGTSEAVDPLKVARDFMRTIVTDGDPQAAAAFQCKDNYTGTTPEELATAIVDWAAANGETTSYVADVVEIESTETSVTLFEAEVTLHGGLVEEDYPFTVAVEGDCVSSLTGGDGLL